MSLARDRIVKIRRYNANLKPFKLKLVGRPLSAREIARKYGVPETRLRILATSVAKSHPTVTTALGVFQGKSAVGVLLDARRVRNGKRLVRSLKRRGAKYRSAK